MFNKEELNLVVGTKLISKSTGFEWEIEKIQLVKDYDVSQYVATVNKLFCINEIWRTKEDIVKRFYIVEG